MFQAICRGWYHASTHRFSHVRGNCTTSRGCNRVLLDLPTSHVTTAPRILIVGDGNFSYSRAITTALQRAGFEPKFVISTSLDTRDELERMYPGASASIEHLESNGVQVRHDINATTLAAYAHVFGIDAFDRIVFNFPHFAEGGNVRNKISKHRELLAKFFESSRSVLAHDGQVWLSLCAGQGGTPADTITRSYGDTWQVIECAAAGQLLLLDVKPFPFSELAALGYGSVGYRLEERAFHSENGLVHVFVPESKTVRSRFPQTWSRDVSLWLGPNFSVGAVESIFREIMGDGFDLKLEKRDEYQCPKSQRQSYMFHVVFTSNVYNLTRQRLNGYIQAIAARLDHDGVGQVRGGFDVPRSNK
ncbi:hypothetical protein LEN26_017585 [Aphanomyces euteiches]|nr:hypothetical protein LEN26_017585 [Aphanomyces euteiches]KAH9196986.1 hypothetical protein AeNC1_001065 [Aphanomyces euteiches]